MRFTSCGGHLEYGQLSRSVPDVPLRLNDHPAAAEPTILMVRLKLVAREWTSLVQFSRRQELKCIASRPYEALSAILKYEKTPIKGASSHIGFGKSDLPTPLKRRDSLVTLHQQPGAGEPNLRFVS